MSESRRRCASAILFALAWPLPVYAAVGSLLIVLNEHVLGVHFFDASELAAVSALGALLGVALAARTGPVGRAVLLAGVAGLTLASEKVSFTQVIERTPGLRELDALGRRHR